MTQGYANSGNFWNYMEAKGTYRKPTIKFYKHGIPNWFRENDNPPSFAKITTVNPRKTILIKKKAA